jgi:hypothetical protein
LTGKPKLPKKPAFNQSNAKYTKPGYFINENRTPDEQLMKRRLSVIMHKQKVP